MRHLVCTVEGGKYTITDSWGVVESKIIPLIKFLDTQKEIKAINPTHSKAWEALSRIYENY